MSGFSDYTTLLPRKEDGDGGGARGGSPLRSIKHYLFLLVHITWKPRLELKKITK